MGLLTVGTPLTWEESEKKAEEIKKHGIIQFINLYGKLKDRQRDVLKWGDEIEYMFIYLDHETKSARLQLKCAEILPVLQEDEKLHPGENINAWRMEYADYMIEGVPGQPFDGCLTQFNRVEDSMRSRREDLMKLLKGPQETIVCYAAFPRIGCPQFTEPIINSSPELNPSSKSLYFPDRAIYPEHPRFVTLTRNIRSRRGKRQAINLPIYRDKMTPDPYYPPIPNDDGEAKLAIKPNHVYMDCMGFGMGCCCLQVTFQACNIEEARVLYDQLAVMAPIMMALSAASPAFQGTLTNVDCRWDVIAGSVDDRTSGERGEDPLPEDKFRIAKSRYDCIDMYISEDSKKFNDQPVNFNGGHKQMLLDAGVDELLAVHIAHLFIRDPISLFAEKLELDDEIDTDHFENIQSTNWQSVRFKPPTDSAVGWRVEFRSMEVQLTDFENAAYVVFIVLLTRIILSFSLNLLIPISKVERNMRNAVKRNAVHTEEFYFRNTLTSDQESKAREELMTIDTIINGKENGFPGLISMMRSYIESIDADVDTCCTISQYISLISKRASGQCKTTATWIRDYTQNHPDYRQNSHVSERINYDLAVLCDKISRGTEPCPDLFGTPKTKSVNVSSPKCIEVKEEVERLTEKILSIESNKKMKDGDIHGADFENTLSRSLGVDVKKGSTQM